MATNQPAGRAVDVLDHIHDGADLIVPLANGEPSTAVGGTVSRIRATLTPGSMVTTLKNTVDHIVTEHGVADMRGRSISQRSAALIAIADPPFRDELTAQARALDYL